MTGGKMGSTSPEKYAATRQQLIGLREADVSLDGDQLKIIQGAITNLSDMERQVEKSLVSKTLLRGDKLNALLSDDSDSLLMVLQDLKKRGGGS